MFAFGAAVGAADAQEQKAPVTTLPAYVVTDSRELPPAEKWLYTRVGGLEIVSSAAEGTTRHLVRDFLHFCQALDLVWPDVQRVQARLQTLILCGRPGEFERFMPPPRAGMPPVLVTLALRDAEHAAMVVDLHAKPIAREEVLDDVGALPNEGTFRDLRGTGDTYRQLYRSYVRFLLASSQPRSPAWFEEGLAQLLMSMRVSDQDVIVGQLHDPNEQGNADGTPLALQDLDFNAVIRRGPTLPMEKLLSLGHDSYEANNATGNMWSKQSYAFVHWGLYGDVGKHQKAFVTFLARLAKQPPSEELFQRTFGQSYKEMTMTLLSYADMTSHRVAGVEAKRGYKLDRAPAFELREATESEAARVRGEALLAGGKVEAARQTMGLPYRRGERDPNLFAAIGLLELRMNEPGAAKKFLELAAQGKPERSRALVELAKLRLGEALAASAAGAGSATAPARLSAAQVVAVLTPLFAARAQPPAAAELYDTVAETWEQSASDPEPAHLGVLDEGVTLFPKRAELVYRTAALKARIGLKTEAATLLALGLPHATDAETRAKFTALQARLGEGAGK